MPITTPTVTVLLTPIITVLLLLFTIIPLTDTTRLTRTPLLIRKSTITLPPDFISVKGRRTSGSDSSSQMSVPVEKNKGDRLIFESSDG